uniref:Uncharacterized protein n=1 Tax=Gadus morhua TaxID=8049 RepID=A0A8C5B603_GADMO
MAAVLGVLGGERKSLVWMRWRLCMSNRDAQRCLCTFGARKVCTEQGPNYFNHHKIPREPLPIGAQLNGRSPKVGPCSPPWILMGKADVSLSCVTQEMLSRQGAIKRRLLERPLLVLSLSSHPLSPCLSKECLSLSCALALSL